MPPAPAKVYRGLAYGSEAQQRLDLYLPSGAGPHKLMVYAHTGGWCCGGRTDLPMFVLDALGAGWAVASIDYALFVPSSGSGSFPRNVHDFKRATRWLRAKAGVYGLNPNMVVAAGASAGGHLAALAATTAGRVLEPVWSAELAGQRADYQGVVSVVGPVNLLRFYANTDPWTPLLGQMLGCYTSCTTAQLTAASPMHQLTPSAPPTYLAYGALDNLVRAQEAYDFEAAYVRTVPFGDRQVWVDVNAFADHNMDYYGLNIVALRRFLSGVASGAFRDPVGNFEAATTWGPQPTVVTGWTLDPDVVDPVAIHAYVDGRWGGATVANTSRLDVARVYPKYGEFHGFQLQLPAQTPGAHQVCVFAINAETGSSNPLLGCRTFVTPGGNPFGNVEGTSLIGGVQFLGGWVIDPDVADPVAVHVYVNNKWYGAYTANGNRPDVGRASWGYGDAHGFAISLDRLGAGTSNVCVYGINVKSGTTNPLIGCRSITR